MDCKFCGAPAPENGVFCPLCGKRLDGKIECNFCKSLIEENSIYCTYCGNRLDGKKKCKECGEFYDGKFCSTCGTKNEIIKKEKNHCVQSQNKTYSKVEKVLSPSLYLGVILVLFICSFFIGVKTSLLGIDKKMETFFFFGDAFSYADKSFSSFENNINFSILKSGTYSVLIICLVVLIINFVIQTICAIMGGIIVGKNMYKGKVACGYKYAIPSFISFFSTTIIVYGLNYFSLNDSLANVKMSAGSLVGIILGTILILSAFVLGQIKNGKRFFNKAWFKRYIPLFSTIALSFVVCFLIIRNAFYYTETGTVNALFLSAGEYMTTIMTELMSVNQVVAPLFSRPLACSITSFVVNTLATISCFALFTILLYALFTGKKLTKSCLAFAIVSTTLAIANMIIALIAAKTFTNLAEKKSLYLVAIGTPTILPFVLSAIILAGVIVYCVLIKNQT